MAVACKLFAFIYFVSHGAACIPYVQVAILCLPHPYLRSTTILFDRKYEPNHFHSKHFLISALVCVHIYMYDMYAISNNSASYVYTCKNMGKLSHFIDFSGLSE